VNLGRIGATTPRRWGVVLNNPVLGHACKWHRSTLNQSQYVSIVLRSNPSTTKNRTYAFRQTNDCVHRAPLKEVSTVWIFIFAHEHNVLRHGKWIATRDFPASSWGDVRNRGSRTPLCTHSSVSEALEASNDASTNTNGQCASSQRTRSQRVCPRNIYPEYTERTSHWRLGLVDLRREQVLDRAKLRFLWYGAFCVLRISHFVLNDGYVSFRRKKIK
jgi:hypothetical protein